MEVKKLAVSLMCNKSMTITLPVIQVVVLIVVVVVVYQAKIMHFPTWVDLKGQDAVPETVHHVVCYVDPTTDMSWKNLGAKITVGWPLSAVTGHAVR